MESVAVTTVETTQCSKKRARSCRSPNGVDRKRIKVADTVEFTVSPEKEQEAEEDASFCAAMAASQEAPFEPPTAHNIVSDGPMEPVSDDLTEEMPCVEKVEAGAAPESDAPTEEMPCVEKPEASVPTVAEEIAPTQEAATFVPPQTVAQEVDAFMAPETKKPARTSEMEVETSSTDAPTEEMPSYEPPTQITEGDENADGDEETEDEDKTVQEVKTGPVCEPQTPLAVTSLNTMVPVLGHTLVYDENSCATVLETPQHAQGKENVTESRFEPCQNTQELIVKPLQFDSQASREATGLDDPKDSDSQEVLTSQEQPSQEQSRFGCSIM